MTVYLIIVHHKTRDSLSNLDSSITITVLNGLYTLSYYVQQMRDLVVGSLLCRALQPLPYTFDGGLTQVTSTLAGLYSAANWLTCSIKVSMNFL